MANKKPLTNTNGLIREFATGDSISVKFGGTGLNALPKDSIILGDSSDTVKSIKYNLNAIIPPSQTDDNNSNYVVGSKWYDITNQVEYTCLDNTIGNAVWKAQTQGSQGNQGNQGAIGAGTQGYQGNQGANGVGTQGYQGNQGADGIGVQGYQGNQGAIGAGTQGYQGNQGADGIGVQGYQGNQGANGVGTQGYQGNQGANGVGLQGPQGYQGAIGSGTQGYQGNQGANGVGTQGYQGNQGATPSTDNLVANVSDSYQVTSIQVVTALPAVGDRVTGRLYFVLSA